MIIHKLKHAVELGKEVKHFIIALNGVEGFPYINSARGIEQIAENQVAIEEWICPVTIRDLRNHPEMTILIRHPVEDHGYEILGRVMMFENFAYMNGYAPEIEENAYLPQTKRRLIIRAEKVVAFNHALRCDDIQQISGKGEAMEPKGNSFVPYCGFAPEWAEHARFDREDQPCDDGRTGKQQECPEGAPECVVGAP